MSGPLRRAIVESSTSSKNARRRKLAAPAQGRHGLRNLRSIADQARSHAVALGTAAEPCSDSATTSDAQSVRAYDSRVLSRDAARNGEDVRQGHPHSRAAVSPSDGSSPRSRPSVAPAGLSRHTLDGASALGAGRPEARPVSGAALSHWSSAPRPTRRGRHALCGWGRIFDEPRRTDPTMPVPLPPPVHPAYRLRQGTGASFRVLRSPPSSSPGRAARTAVADRKRRQDLAGDFVAALLALLEHSDAEAA